MASTDPYDAALSAIRSHVDDLGAWLAIWLARAEPDAHAAAPRTPWTPRWPTCTASTPAWWPRSGPAMTPAPRGIEVLLGMRWSPTS